VAQTVTLAPGALVAALADPAAFDRARAIELAVEAAREIPLLDVKLARELPELAPAAAERVLAILDAVSDGSRLVFLLSPLLRHRDARLRSKAAKLIGRTTRRPAWVEKQLGQTDARERANSVEALWGLRSAEAKAVFAKAVNDPSQRVAVNGIVGLYKLGDAAAVSMIQAMATMHEAALRTRVAWAMGEIGDPRFLPALAEMDPEPEGVGRQISRAVERILRNQDRIVKRGRLDVAAGEVRATTGGWREWILWLSAPGEGKPLELESTEFVIWENDLLVADYHVDRPGGTGALAVAFAFAGEAALADRDLDDAEEAVLACLNRARGNDRWAVWKGDRPAASMGSDKTTLREAIRRRAVGGRAWGHSERLRDWAQTLAACRGRRNLIVLAGPGVKPLAPLEGVVIHAIAVGDFEPPHPLEAVCRRSGGIFLAAREAEGLADACSRIYSSLSNRYQVLYRPEPETDLDVEPRVRVQIYCGYGYGEAAAL